MPDRVQAGQLDWSDYDLPHEDIRDAKKIEAFYGMFRLFALRSQEMITLALAAFRTLARSTDGLFSREDMDRSLAHLTRGTRARVVQVLLDYGWIATNGVSYEIPERAKVLHIFLFGALARPELGFAQDIRVAFAMMDLDQAAATEAETASGNLEVAVHTLKAVRAQIRRVMEQRSAIEARRVLERSQHVRQAIDDVMKRLKQQNRVFYRYGLTTEILSLCSEIKLLHGELILFIHRDVQANARSFGQYLSPEQLEEFLQKADTDQLAALARRRFASPRSWLFVPRDEILRKGLAYLQQRPEQEEPTPPPPVTEVVHREVTVHRQEGPAQEYYRELMIRLQREGDLRLHAAVVGTNWGQTLFRSGLLVGIHRELVDDPGKPGFEIAFENRIETLPAGPVAEITAGRVYLPEVPRHTEEE